jgi:hypothetical protein
MPTTNAIIGAGTTLGYASSQFGSYTSLAELADAGIPSDTADEAEATHYLSPNTRKEFLAGWLDAGEVELDLNYTAAQYAALIAILRVTKWWKLTLPDGSLIYYQGWIKKHGGVVPNKERVQIKTTIRVTSAPSFIQAS